MRIPSAEAVIPKEKLTHYLLLPREEDDKSKFLARAGFNVDNPDELEKAIRGILQENEAIPDRRNEYGTYYRVVGSLVGVSRRILQVVTVWIVLVQDDGTFRFVTLKPLKE